MHAFTPRLVVVGKEGGALSALLAPWAEPAGFSLVCASTAAEAESLLASAHAAVVVVDLGEEPVEPDRVAALESLARRAPTVLVAASARDKRWWSHETQLSVLTRREVKGQLGITLLRLALLGDRAQPGERRAEGTHPRLAAAVEFAAESILITDPDGAIEYVNPAFEKITGYRRDEVVGQTPRILKSGKHEPEFYAKMWETLLRGEVWTGHLTNKHKDGSLLEVEATISSLFDRDGRTTGYVAVQRDVTQEMKLSRQLHDAQRMEALGQLAGGVAHDFNNILTAILGNLSLALNSQLPERVRPLLADTERASLRAAELVKQLLTFSRKSETVLRPVVVDEVIREVAAIARNTFDRRIEIAALCAQDLRPVLADSGQLHQVLLNLCVNARDALEAVERGPRPAALRITIEADNASLDEAGYLGAGVPRPGDYVRISVSDNGIGMSEEVKKRVFDPFFTTKAEGKGTGLGLATVYGIIKQHDGGVTLYSEPGYGSSFKVYLPVARPTGMRPSAGSEDAPSRGSETILLVDDEEIIRALCTSVLTRHGYRVVPAADGREALQLYSQREKEIDLVVLDLSMPQLSGLETLQRLRAFNSKVRVILSSGYSLDPAHELLHQPCVLGFIPKPYQPVDLVRMVRRALDETSGSA